MHYEIGNRLIKAENTAKSHHQQSKIVVNYLRSNSVVDSILDFGCGKLRYSNVIVGLSKKVTFVDSKIQLNRKQIIRGKFTTVVEYIDKYYPGCKAIAFEDLKDHRQKYDIVVCTNVLSAIPSKNMLDLVLKNIKTRLNRGGKAIIVNQHRNSYFEKFKSGEKHLYGYLYKTNGQTTYYGIMTADRIETLIKKTGLCVLNSRFIGEINIVEAGYEH